MKSGLSGLAKQQNKSFKKRALSISLSAALPPGRRLCLTASKSTLALPTLEKIIEVGGSLNSKDCCNSAIGLSGDIQVGRIDSTNAEHLQPSKVFSP